ncbi:MAG: phospholipase D-like domain-containing protein [Candidatus Lokiarchaeota archaeon]
MRELNKDIKIKIITSNKIYEGYLEGLKEIRKLDNYEVILTKNKVHCKVYIFDDEIAIISSVNLYFPQWITSLDSGIIIKEKRIIKELLKIAERLESNQGQLETVQIEYMSQSISTDSLIENISFLFDTEGKKLIPTLRKNHSQPIEEESKTIQSKSKIITKYKQKSNKIEILTNFFGKETIDEEEKELLKIKKLNLIKKLRFYNTNKKEIDLKRNRTSKIIYNLKIIRNDAQWRLKSLKNERENLLRKRDKIKEKISEQKRREELSYYLDNLKEIKMKLKKLWKKHQKYDEKSQKFHKKFIFFLDKKKDLRNKRRELNEKITEIKKELNLLNIKIINYKNEEEIDELDWTIIVEDFYEYILMCPYQKDIEIKWYISDFLTIIGLIPSTKLFFDVLQLGFNSSNPLKIAGKIYNILQLGSPKWGKMFKSSVPGLFKNVLLSQGDSGIEVKDLKEYFKFKEDFENCFAISSPEPREIFNLILKQSKSMKKIISNDVNYKKFCDLFNNCDGFNDFKSEIDKKREGLSAD